LRKEDRKIAVSRGLWEVLENRREKKHSQRRKKIGHQFLEKGHFESVCAWGAHSDGGGFGGTKKRGRVWGGKG